MNLGLIGFSLDILGKILVAYTAIKVHYRFRKEHQVDEKVFAVMKKEQYLGILGIILMIIGFLLQLPGKF